MDLNLISDVLLLTGALCACVYCFVLSKRLKKLASFESGLGGAIAVLSTQVDDMQRVLQETEATAGEASAQLRELVKEAEDVAGNLDVLLASLTDLPEATSEPPLVLTPRTPPQPVEEPETPALSFATARARTT